MCKPHTAQQILDKRDTEEEHVLGADNMSRRCINAQTRGLSGGTHDYNKKTVLVCLIQGSSQPYSAVVYGLDGWNGAHT